MASRAEAPSSPAQRTRLPRLGTVVRAALSDYYFNSMRLVAANLVWGLALALILLVGLVSPLAGPGAAAPPRVPDRRRLPPRGAHRPGRARRGCTTSPGRIVTRPAAGSWSAIAVVAAGSMLATNVVVGLVGGEPARWAIATLAGWGLVVAVVRRARRLAAPRRPGTVRDAPRRTAFAWPAGCSWRTRSASPGWALAMAVVTAVSVVLTAAILTISVAFVALVACRSVYPAADRLEPALARGAPVTLPIQVGPSTITMNRDDRFVVCQPDGRIERLAEEGFFARDTRFVSGYEVFLNGQRPALLNASPVQFYSSRFEYTNPELLDRDGVVPRNSLGSAHRPDGLRRRPRGLRPRQLRAAARPPDDRDRDRVRLRRHLRRQGRPARPPRRDQRALVPLEPRAPDDLRPSRVRPRAGHPGGPLRQQAPVRQRPVRVHRRGPAEGRLAYLPALAAADQLEAAAEHAGVQRGRRAVAGRGSDAPPPSPHRDPQPHRPARVGSGPARHGLAPARGPDVRQGRLHPGRRRAVVRDPVRARLAGRLDAGHQRLPGVRGRGAAPPVRAAGHRRRPRARHGAGQDPARDPSRRARPAAHPAVPAVLRHPRRDEPVRDRHLVPLPMARRRRRPGALPAQRRGGDALDRPVGRPRSRRLPGVQDPLDARLLQPGLEGRRRRHPARRRLARAAAARAVRAAGLRL